VDSGVWPDDHGSQALSMPARVGVELLVGIGCSHLGSLGCLEREQANSGGMAQEA
jgi:hypothetical protein